MNLANKITLLRICFIPIFMIFLLVKIPYGITISIIIFLLASITDKVDGYIARSKNQITNFGKFMDPLADKLLISTALISLVQYQIFPAWIVIIIIAREFAITGFRTIAAAEGVILAAGKSGKFKTVTQIVAVTCALVDLDLGCKILFFSILAKVAIVLALAITIFSGAEYLIKNKSLLKYN